MVEWLKDGAEAVPQDLSIARANVCAHCPHNQSGDLTSFFTVPVSNAIRKALADKDGMNLATPIDDQLHVCGICLCPMKLKVHVPLKTILDRLPTEVFTELPEYCWMRTEKP